MRPSHQCVLRVWQYMNVGKVTLEEGVSGFFESSLWQKWPCGCTTRGFCNTLLFLTSVLSEMGGKSPLPLYLISEVCLGDTERRVGVALWRMLGREF